MSEKNVDIVRAIYDAVARRDAARVLSLYDANVEIRSAPGALFDHVLDSHRTTWVGHEGLRAFDRELSDAFELFETTCDEMIDAGNQVVTISKYRVRGRGSGLELDGPLQYGVWTIQDGLVTRVVWFPTREDALDAAGLR